MPHFNTPQSIRVARFLAAKYGRLLLSIRDVRQGQYLRIKFRWLGYYAASNTGDFGFCPGDGR